MLWVALLCFGLAWAGIIELQDDLGCEHAAGESNYGEQSWSVLPPGPVCSWTAEVNGVDDVRGPTPVMSAWLPTLFMLGTLVVWRARQDRSGLVATGPPSGGIAPQA